MRMSISPVQRRHRVNRPVPEELALLEEPDDPKSSMHPYDDLVMLRNEHVRGLGPWWWIKGEHGAWAGPHREFDGLHDIFLQHVKKTDVIVQAGGCLGLYPRLWAETFGWVYTFEPDPLNFYCLVRNCQMDKIVKLQAGLGERAQMLQVNRQSMDNVGMHSVSEQGVLQVIPQVRIDDLGLPACDAIQLDVEGFELPVLMGAMETIGRFHPVISIETCHPPHRELLQGLGYSEVARNVSDTIFAVK